jgi:hypothetical protein
MRCAHAHREAVRVEGHLNVADIGHEQLGLELVEPFERFARG